MLCDRCPLRLIYFSLPNRVKATEHNDPALSSIQLNEGCFFLNLFFFIQFYILYFLLVSLVNYYDETKYWYLSIVKIKLNKIKFLIKKLNAISMYDSVYWYG